MGIRRVVRGGVRGALPLLAAALAACDGGASGTAQTVVGSGTLVSEARPVGDFSRVDLGGVGRLEAAAAGDASLVVVAEDNIQPHVRAETRGGTLYLTTAGDTPIATALGIDYLLAFRRLEALAASGTTVAAIRGLRAPAFEVSGSGVTTVAVSGAAEVQSVTLSGSSIYLASELESRDVTVVASGLCRAVVRATGRLRVDASGSARVEYLGDPVLDVTTSGTATVARH